MQLTDRIGRRIKLQDLHVLMTVVQAGSMSKGAQRLNSTQPNVSRSISELEHALGVRLLDRHQHGIELTAYGRALLDGGVAAFDDLRQAVKNIEFLADPTAGEVSIGSAPPLAANFVSAVIDKASRRHPRIVFHLAVSPSETLYRELIERNVDFVIAERFGQFTDEQLGFERLYHESYAVVAGAQNPWARRRRIALAELANEPWVLPPPESGPASVAREIFRASGVDYPRVTVVTFPREVRLNLVAAGRFLTVAPASVSNFPTKRPDLKVLPVSLPIDPVPHGIITLRNRTLNPVARVFIEHAREIAKLMIKRKVVSVVHGAASGAESEGTAR